VAGAGGQFGNQKEREGLSLEAIAKELVMTQLTEKTKCML
jgi:hypothetical protein